KARRLEIGFCYFRVVVLRYHTYASAVYTTESGHEESLLHETIDLKKVCAVSFQGAPKSTHFIISSFRLPRIDREFRFHSNSRPLNFETHVLHHCIEAERPRRERIQDCGV